MFNEYKQFDFNFKNAPTDFVNAYRDKLISAANSSDYSKHTMKVTIDIDDKSFNFNITPIEFNVDVRKPHGLTPYGRTYSPNGESLIDINTKNYVTNFDISITEDNTSVKKVFEKWILECMLDNAPTKDDVEVLWRLSGMESGTDDILEQTVAFTINEWIDPVTKEVLENNNII